VSGPNVLNYASVNPLPREERQLRLLVIIHYVTAGLVALQLPLFGLGMFFAFGATPQARQFLSGWFSDVAPIMGCWAVLGVFSAVSAKLISLRKFRWFSIICAGALCFAIPFGTITGIAAMILLKRQTAKQIYARHGTSDIIPA
jgi:hypothetical protein